MDDKIPLSSTEKIRKVWDAHLIKNEFSAYIFNFVLGIDREALDRYWSKREDITLGFNSGFYLGRESVYNQCLEQAGLWKSTGAARTDHYLTSPVIETDREGLTAKAMFYNPGVFSVDGIPYWSWGRYAVDFVREDGGWKIWHLGYFSDFSAVVGKKHNVVPPERQRDVYVEKNYNVEPELSALLYDPRYGWPDMPRYPVPFEEFKDTYSYGPGCFGFFKEGDQ